MTVTIVGDFADPMSFLASQRVEQLRSLGLLDVNWIAVESDRARPMTGRPLDTTVIENVRRLAAPGEALPAADLRVPNSRAATAAYVESFTEGVPDAMRRALFDALWVHGRDVGDPDVIRRIVFDVFNPIPPYGDIDWRIRANLPLVSLGGTDPIVTTRRLGFIVSMGRGPLTVVGQLRIDESRRLWQQRGAPAVPFLITDLGEAFSGEDALTWLADRLPHRDPVATTGENATLQRPAELPLQRERVPTP